MISFEDIMNWLGLKKSDGKGFTNNNKAKVNLVKDKIEEFYINKGLKYPSTSLDNVIINESFHIEEAELKPIVQFDYSRWKFENRRPRHIIGEVIDKESTNAEADNSKDTEEQARENYYKIQLQERKNTLSSWCESSSILLPKKVRDFIATASEIDESQRTWIERLPWYEEECKQLETSDIKTAEEILNKEIYGLDEVKRQVLEFIATQITTSSAVGNVLLLDGPPGIGKTSIADAIATALHRKSYSIKMPAYSSAWELCGLDKSWKGAKPGLIIDALITTKSFSPVIILDELDKLVESKREQGSIPSVLLSILDSKRDEYMDSFLRVPVDLSKVIFIATSNNYRNISPILVDRFKVIELKGYKPSEKIVIAEDYIIPKQKAAYKFSDSDISIEKDAIKTIVDNYAVEPGVRGLIQYIQSIFSYASKYKVDGCGKLRVTSSTVKEILKDPIIKSRSITATVGTGDAYMLDFHGVSGLFNIVQATLYPGSGKVIKTGFTNPKLNECLDIILSHLKKYSLMYDIEYELFMKSDIHINIVSSNVYYPSEYSLTMFAALLSAIKGFATGPIAFIGEITLNGDILPVENLGDKFSSFALSETAEILMTRLVSEEDKSMYTVPKGKEVFWKTNTFEVYDELKKKLKIG